MSSGEGVPSARDGVVAPYAEQTGLVGQKADAESLGAAQGSVSSGGASKVERVAVRAVVVARHHQTPRSLEACKLIRAFSRLVAGVEIATDRDQVGLAGHREAHATRLLRSMSRSR